MRTSDLLGLFKAFLVGEEGEKEEARRSLTDAYLEADDPGFAQTLAEGFPGALRYSPNPSGDDYTMKEGYEYVWVRVKNIDVHIRDNDEGVSVDLRGAYDNAETISSCWATFSEAEPEEEFTPNTCPHHEWILQPDGTYYCPHCGGTETEEELLEGA